MTPAKHGQEYRNASMPTVLAKRIVRVLRENPELGYRTLSDFVRHAALDKLRQVENHLALVAIHATIELGADAVEALLRDNLPPEYQRLLEGEP